MKITKFIGFFACAMIMGTFSFANAQSVAGAGASYGMDFEEIGFKGEYYHDLSSAVPNLRLGGGFTYFLPKSRDESGGFGDEVITIKNEVSYMLIEVNAQYLFKASDTLTAYGLAGLRHARLSLTRSGNGESVSADEDDTGLQVGGGAEFSVGGTRLFAEGVLGLGDVDELIVNFGARFAL